MNVRKELVKKGKKDHAIADLDVSQTGDMTISISSGPVFWGGEDFTLKEGCDYVVEVDPEEKWIDIFLVKRVSDNKCVVFIDEGHSCEMRYNFTESSEYVCMYKIAGISIPKESTTLNDAVLVLRRWVDPEKLAKNKGEQS